MKSLLVLALLGLTGCSSLTLPPNVSCETWTHTGNYGPFLQTHVVVTGVTYDKTANSLHIGNYVGTLGVLGYGPSDSFHDLTVAGTNTTATPSGVTVSK